MSGFGDVVTRLDFGVTVQLLLRHYVTHEVLGHTVCGKKEKSLMLTSLTGRQSGFPSCRGTACGCQVEGIANIPVSYTHLTLPTTRSV